MSFATNYNCKGHFFNCIGQVAKDTIFHNGYTLEGFSKPCKKFGQLGENYN
jgi:hypothetical protein